MSEDVKKEASNTSAPAVSTVSSVYGWTCDTCMVGNDAAATQCVCCEAKRDGGVPVSKPSLFDTKPAIVPTTALASTGGGFSFTPAASSTTLATGSVFGQTSAFGFGGSHTPKTGSTPSTTTTSVFGQTSAFGQTDFGFGNSTAAASPKPAGQSVFGVPTGAFGSPLPAIVSASPLVGTTTGGFSFTAAKAASPAPPVVGGFSFKPAGGASVSPADGSVFSAGPSAPGGGFSFTPKEPTASVAGGFTFKAAHGEATVKPAAFSVTTSTAGGFNLNGASTVKPAAFSIAATTTKGFNLNGESDGDAVVGGFKFTPDAASVFGSDGDKAKTSGSVMAATAPAPVGEKRDKSPERGRTTSPKREPKREKSREKAAAALPTPAPAPVKAKEAVVSDEPPAAPPRAKAPKAPATHSTAEKKGSQLDVDFLEVRQEPADVKVRVSDAFEHPSDENIWYNLLAISNKFGYVVYATRTGFAFALTKDVREAVAKATGAKLATVASAVDVEIPDDIVNQGETKALKTIPSSSDEDAVLLPNPEAYPDICAVHQADGSLSMLNIESDEFKPVEFGEFYATAICWSRKGKQLAVGDSEGVVRQVSLEGAIKNTIAAPPSIKESEPEVQNIFWLEDKVFVVIYTIPEKPSVAFVITQTGTAKTGIKTEYLELEDPCQFSSDERQFYYYSSLVSSLGDATYVMPYANFGYSDIGFLGFKEGQWSNWSIGEGVFLPLDSNDDDTYPVGLDIDFTNESKVVAGSGSLPPAPLLYVLNTDGNLLVYNLMDKSTVGKDIACPAMAAAAPLVGGSRNASPAREKVVPAETKRDKDPTKTTSIAPVSAIPVPKKTVAAASKREKSPDKSAAPAKFTLPVTNASGWTCKGCMVQNAEAATQCVCCETKRVSEAAPPKPSLFNSKGSAAASTPASAEPWTCDSCMVPNDATATQCVCCETKRAGVVTPPKPSLFESKPAAATAAGTGGGFSFTPAPGTTPASGSLFGSTGFGFGNEPTGAPLTGATTGGFSFGGATSSAAAPVSGGFSFKPAASDDKAKAPVGFSFTPAAASSTSAAASGGFSFKPSTTDDKTKTPVSGGFNFKPTDGKAASRNGGFSFTPAATSTTSGAPVSGGFSFKPATVDDKAKAPAPVFSVSGGFSFTPTVASNTSGAASTASTSGSGFGFGNASAAPVTDAATGGFSFGGAASTPSTTPTTGGFSIEAVETTEKAKAPEATKRDSSPKRETSPETAAAPPAVPQPKVSTAETAAKVKEAKAPVVGTVEEKQATELEVEFIDVLQIPVGVSIRASEAFDHPPEETVCYNLLAISNKFGYVVYGMQSGFGFALTKDVREAMSKAHARQLVDVSTKVEVEIPDDLVNQIRLSSDEQTVLIGLTSGKISLYRASQLTWRATASLTPAIPLKTFKGPTDDDFVLLPNPEAFPETCAVNYGDGTLHMLNIVKGTFDKVDLDFVVAAMCWSRKGKQLAVGDADGVVRQITLEGVIKNTIPAPPSLKDAEPEVQNILWLEDKVFVVIYTTSGDPCVSFVITQTGTAKTGVNTAYWKLDDPCPFHSRCLNYYGGLVNAFGDTTYLIPYANFGSNEIGFFGCKDGEWCNWRIGDGITLPLDSDDNDTLPVGLDIDFTSDAQIKGSSPDAHSLQPAPLVYVLHSGGQLLAYNLIDKTSAGRESSCSNMMKPEQFVGSIAERVPTPTKSEPLDVNKASAPSTGGFQFSAPKVASSVPANSTPFGLFGRLGNVENVSSAVNSGANFGFTNPPAPPASKPTTPLSFALPPSTATSGAASRNVFDTTGKLAPPAIPPVGLFAPKTDLPKANPPLTFALPPSGKTTPTPVAAFATAKLTNPVGASFGKTAVEEPKPVVKQEPIVIKQEPVVVSKPPPVPVAAVPAPAKRESKPKTYADPSDLSELFDRMCAEMEDDLRELNATVGDSREFVDKAGKNTKAIVNETHIKISEFKKEMQSVEFSCEKAANLNKELESALQLIKGKQSHSGKLIKFLNDGSRDVLDSQRELGPEFAHIQSTLQKKIKRLESELSDVKDSLLEIKDELEVRSGVKLATNLPDWETLCRNIRRITAHTVTISKKLDGMLTEVQQHKRIMSPKAKQAKSLTKTKNVYGAVFAAGSESDDDNVRPKVVSPVPFAVNNQQKYLASLKTAAFAAVKAKKEVAAKVQEEKGKAAAKVAAEAKLVATKLISSLPSKPATLPSVNVGATSTGPKAPAPVESKPVGSTNLSFAATKTTAKDVPAPTFSFAPAAKEAPSTGLGLNLVSTAEKKVTPTATGSGLGFSLGSANVTPGSTSLNNPEAAAPVGFSFAPTKDFGASSLTRGFNIAPAPASKTTTFGGFGAEVEKPVTPAVAGFSLKPAENPVADLKLAAKDEKVEAAKPIASVPMASPKPVESVPKPGLAFGSGPAGASSLSFAQKPQTPTPSENDRKTPTEKQAPNTSLFGGTVSSIPSGASTPAVGFKTATGPIITSTPISAAPTNGKPAAFGFAAAPAPAVPAAGGNSFGFAPKKPEEPNQAQNSAPAITKGFGDALSFGGSATTQNKVNPMFGGALSAVPASTTSATPTVSAFGGAESVFGKPSRPTTPAAPATGFSFLGAVSSQNASPAPTSQSAFGQGASPFGAKPNGAFVQPPASTGTPASGFVFGQASPASGFGQSAFGQSAKAANGVSVFGSTASTSAFGQPVDSGSAFGQATTSVSANAGSAFGQPSATTTSSAFGKPAAPSVFGQAAPSTPQSAFGQSTFGQSTFGQSPGQSAFGHSTTKPQAAFGQGTSAFGTSPSGVTSTGAPAFGQSGFGQQSAFGQPGFGTAAPLATAAPGFASVATKSVFGQATAGAATGFGGFAATANTGQSVFGGSASGGQGFGTSGGSVFGGASQQQQGFGASTDKKASFSNYR
ncbi:UNVERIFIED_CONTAM: hypothetical protein HDU68_008173 [Siphonaria sp. JEL0065]|nr:hypothetical protein HDU68_008173 [Siphonaria sp. JEL0065]